jgi:glycosyltransferase involved in cell wall biosynthesis
MQLIVITTLYHDAVCVADGVRALREQTHADFRCVLVDDLSRDDTAARARKAIDGDGRFTLVVNTERRYKTRNVAEAIHTAAPRDADVILVVDGDDRLAHAGALATVARVYRETGCWMTYGSYRDATRPGTEIHQPYDADTLARGNARCAPWRASHLRTFRFGLWRRIRPDAFGVSEAERRAALRRALAGGRLRAWMHWRTIGREALLDPSGRFTRRCEDKTVTYPMLEMARERVCHISEVLYLYEYKRSLGAAGGGNGRDRRARWEQRLLRDVIRHKPRYARLAHL